MPIEREKVLVNRISFFAPSRRSAATSGYPVKKHPSLKYLGQILLLALVAVLQMNPAMVHAEKQPTPKRILILNSFNISNQWENTVRKSFRAAMAGSQVGTLEISEEILDLSSGTAKGHKDILVKLLQVKYSQRGLDLVIGVSDPASEFLLEHGEALFPGIPIVISGSGKEAFKHPPQNRPVTSVYFEFDMLAGLKFALKMLPATRKVLVVAGSDPLSRYLRKLAQKQLAGLGPSPKVTYVPEMTMEEIKSLVSGLPPGHLVLYIAVGKDSAGKKYNPNEACQMISDAANAPVIAITDTNMGSGILGGSLASAEAKGRTLAKVALRILAGENPDDIPATRVPDHVVFDWRQLKRWNLLDHPLTTGAEVRYQQYSFFDLYWHWVLVGAGLLVLQTLVILLLLVQRRLKREKERERQRSEKALRESEELYRQMFHADRVMQLLVDPQNGAVVDANQAACEFYGYSHSEMTSKKVFDINTADPGKITALLSEIENRKTHSFHTKHRLASREIRDVEIYSSPLTQQGRTLLHSSLFDITKRKQAEKALRVSEEKFSKVFFASPVPTTITTLKEGRILEANNSFLKRIGYSREECLGQTSIELGLWSDPNFDRQRMLDLFHQQGYLRNIEVKTPLKNQARTLLWSADSIFYDNQECLLRVHIDITERKQAEEALLRSETQFRVLVDSAPVGIVIQTGGNIVYVNNKAVEAFGAQGEEELLDQSILERVNPGLHDLVKDHIILMNQDKLSPPPMEYQFVKLDGSPFNVEVLSVPIHYQEADGALVFFQDITRRKKTGGGKAKAGGPTAPIAENGGYRHSGRRHSPRFQ
jgi:PAS domain S-box-containing protein